MHPPKPTTRMRPTNLQIQPPEVEPMGSGPSEDAPTNADSSDETDDAKDPATLDDNAPNVDSAGPGPSEDAPTSTDNADDSPEVDKI